MIHPQLRMLVGAAQESFYQGAKHLTNWTTEIGPNAMHVASLNKTFVLWSNVGLIGNKNVQIAAFDHSTQTWSERYIVGNYNLTDDSHGRPAICRDVDGYFYVFFGSHATTQPWSISTNPDDITSWTQQTPLSGAQTYPHPFAIGNALAVLLRNDAVLSRRTLCVRTATSSSGSATFGALTALVDYGASTRAYIGDCLVVGTKIHIVSTPSDAGDTFRRNVYYYVYNTATGALENHDNSFSTASGSLPISLATADANYRIYTHTAPNRGNMPSLCFDSSGDPHVIDVDGTDGGGYVFWHMKRTAGVWSSPAAVATAFAVTPGIGFVTQQTIVAGAAGTVEVWYIDASGNKQRKVRSSSGVWSAEQLIEPAVGGLALRDNCAVLDAHAQMRTLFAECSPGISATDSAAVYARRFAYGDSGVINVAVPSATIDTNWANVQLLFGFEQRAATTTFVNDADSVLLATANGNAQADTAQSKFGASSLLLDGTGDFVTVQHNSVLSLSGGDFTVECWVRRNGASKLQCIFAKRPAVGSSEFAAHITAANVLQWAAFSTSAAVIALVGTTTINNTGTWYHTAFTRQGTTWRMFLDGVLEGSAVESATPSSNSSVFNIGRDPSNTARDFNGRIDEFRFTSGVCRYTANFTPPAAAFPRR